MTIDLPPPSPSSRLRSILAATFGNLPAISAHFRRRAAFRSASAAAAASAPLPICGAQGVQTIRNQSRPGETSSNWFPFRVYPSVPPPIGPEATRDQLRLVPALGISSRPSSDWSRGDEGPARAHNSPPLW
eukprot:3594404-Pyramimonas_sp.AAC.1